MRSKRRGDNAPMQKIRCGNSKEYSYILVPIMRPNRTGHDGLHWIKKPQQHRFYPGKV